jgi:hypothetical protein
MCPIITEMTHIITGYDNIISDTIYAHAQFEIEICGRL